MIDNIDRRIKDYLLKLPLMTWVLLGFFITFFSFFVVPVFFDPSNGMQFNQYIPVFSPIGHDFRIIVSASSNWLHTGAVPATLYPPGTIIFFSPLALLDYESRYKILILIILLCYALSTLVLPQWINGSKGLSALAMLIFVTGLFSYGLQFELERGQWNLMAFTFCLVAIYMFHHSPRRRWLAYLFFTISVQLKLYPAIFVFGLIEDWSDWKNNIKRIFVLGIVNILALFIFGFGPIRSMIGSMGNMEASHVGWQFNLSISSFVSNILSLSFLPRGRIISWLQANSWLPQLFLFAFFAVCFLIILWQAYKKGSKGFNPCVFMACSIGALIIPAISFDYKLSILPASIVLLIPVLRTLEQGENRFSIVFLTFLFSIAYFSLLYSYVNKPGIFQYDLPALFILLTICTVLSYVRSDGIGNTASGDPQVNSVDR